MFLIFSASPSPGARSLRIICGLFSSLFMSIFLPRWTSGAFATLFMIYFVGSWLSVWSAMSLGASLIWFSKRSIRKETAFLILFLLGVAAIGIRQARDYAMRQAGLTGLPRVLDPDSMRHLQLSPSLAMRIQFDQPMPGAPEALYFRADTLDRFDGAIWSPGISRIQQKNAPTPLDTAYTVTLSPRYSDFAPVLDYGVTAQSRGLSFKKIITQLSARDNGVFQSPGLSRLWVKYQATSRSKPLHTMQKEDRLHLTNVPKSADPRLWDLSKSLHHDGEAGRFMISFSDFLEKQSFKYTIKPNSTSLADFALVGREGYCAQFAALAATTARMGGIPSRIVTGFLGGRWDDAGQTLYVRDLDAHAWVELWDILDQRWVRFDPVATLAPARVEHGAEFYLRSIGASIPSEYDFERMTLMAGFYMGFDDFIESLNDGSFSNVGEIVVAYGEYLLMIGTLGLLASYVILRKRRLRSPNRSPDLLLAQQLSNVFSRIDLEKSPGEPLDVWLERVVGLHGELRPVLSAFSDAFCRFRYSRDRQDRDLETMKACLRTIQRQHLLHSDHAKGR
jgi:hypothetical protein